MASGIAVSCISAMIGKTSFSAFSTTNPAKLKLMSGGTNNEAGDGTEISGGSYPAGGIGMTISSTFGAAGYSAGVASVTNSGALVQQTNMPAVSTPGVTDASIYDGTATPVRWWWGTLTSAVITNLGDTLTFATSSITVQLNV
jgi:hypothetical protein